MRAPRPGGWRGSTAEAAVRTGHCRRCAGGVGLPSGDGGSWRAGRGGCPRHRRIGALRQMPASSPPRAERCRREPGRRRCRGRRQRRQPALWAYPWPGTSTPQPAGCPGSASRHRGIARADEVVIVSARRPPRRSAAVRAETGRCGAGSYDPLVPDPRSSTGSRPPAGPPLPVPRHRRPRRERPGPVRSGPEGRPGQPDPAAVGSGSGGCRHGRAQRRTSGFLPSARFRRVRAEDRTSSRTEAVVHLRPGQHVPVACLPAPIEETTPRDRNPICRRGAARTWC